jgi:hypothetical protein
MVVRSSLIFPPWWWRRYAHRNMHSYKNHMTSHPRRLNSSQSPLWKPGMLHKISRLDSVVEKKCVSCEVRNGFIYTRRRDSSHSCWSYSLGKKAEAMQCLVSIDHKMRYLWIFMLRREKAEEESSWVSSPLSELYWLAQVTLQWLEVPLTRINFSS